jgi:hypothetical protein
MMEKKRSDCITTDSGATRGEEIFSHEQREASGTKAG